MRYRLEYRMRLHDGGFSEWRFSRSYASEKAREDGLRALGKSKLFEYRRK